MTTVALSALEWRRKLSVLRERDLVSAGELHVATRLAELGGLSADDGPVVVALTLAVRAPSEGHLCLDLDRIDSVLGRDPEPDESATAEDRCEQLRSALELDMIESAEQWRDLLRAEHLSSLVVEVTDPDTEVEDVPFVLSGSRLYLQRYWSIEQRLALEIRERAVAVPARSIELTDDAERIIGAASLNAAQRRGLESALTRGLSIVVGGPGTGKTHMVGSLLAVLLDATPEQGVDSLRIALMAPSGKAASRLKESIEQSAHRLRDIPEFDGAALADRFVDVENGTIHRLLGWSPGSSRFRHSRSNPLPHDIVIVDETSMVSAELMLDLLDAVSPTARIVLLGDPGQLASVEAGSVLSDLVQPVIDTEDTIDVSSGVLFGAITELTESHRFSSDSQVGRFAAAVRRSDVSGALAVLRNFEGPTEGDGTEVRVEWLEESIRSDASAERVASEVRRSALALRNSALAGKFVEALNEVARTKVLCAHQAGTFGVERWNRLADATVGQVNGANYVGRPIMVLRNNPSLEVYNGDIGVVIDTSDLGQRVCIGHPQSARKLLPAMLDDVDTVHALTIHKSQGSEFRNVTVVLPPAQSPLATRELLYTAITRASEGILLVGEEEALIAAIGNRVSRASGLTARLWDRSEE